MEREERKGGKKGERRRGWEKFEKQERERETEKKPASLRDRILSVFKCVEELRVDREVSILAHRLD